MICSDKSFKPFVSLASQYCMAFIATSYHYVTQCIPLFFSEVHESFSGHALRTNQSKECEPPPTDTYEPQSSLPTKVLQVSQAVIKWLWLASLTIEISLCAVYWVCGGVVVAILHFTLRCLLGLWLSFGVWCFKVWKVKKYRGFMVVCPSNVRNTQAASKL